MKAKEVNKDRQIVPNETLTDLPVAEAQADDTKGGGQDTPHKQTIEIASWTLSSSNPSS